MGHDSQLPEGYGDSHPRENSLALPPVPPSPSPTVLSTPQPKPTPTPEATFPAPTPEPLPEPTREEEIPCPGTPTPSVIPETGRRPQSPGYFKLLGLCVYVDKTACMCVCFNKPMPTLLGDML